MAPTIEEAPLLLQPAKEGEEARIRVNRRARLRATVVRHAMAHPARLRALLKTAPPSVIPTLLRAIAISESGYEEALQSLH